MHVEVNCGICGKAFLTLESRLSVGRGKYCSNACRHAARSRQLSGPNSGFWRGGKVSGNCESCGREFFKSPSSPRRYCSKVCADTAKIGTHAGAANPSWDGGPVAVACEQCGDSFYVNRNKAETTQVRFCSMACKAASQRRDKVTLTCKACGREFERFPSEVRKAFIREADGPYCGRECRGNVMSERQKGEANPSWKGGITPERQKLRYGKKNADWRKAVLERDNYTCRSCGARSEPGKFVLMHAHHIKGFAEYPELRFDIDNGMTLCVPCHFKIHKRKRWIIG